jgi:hypothetical protein
MRSKNWLLCLGLLAAMAWAIGVTASSPNGFDPSEDCALTAGRSGDYRTTPLSSQRTRSHGIEVTTQWFPPRSTCHFSDGRVYDFISPARSVVLTVLAVLIALVLAGGLALAVKRLFETGGVIRSDEAIDLRMRQASHLAAAAFTGCVATGAYVFAGLFSIIMGGYVGAVITLLAGFLALAAVASALDRAYGPLPSTAARSRRRGTAAAAITFVAFHLASAANWWVDSSTGASRSGASFFPVLLAWAALVGAVVLPVVAVVQWARPGRPLLPAPERTPATAGRSAEHQ